MQEHVGVEFFSLPPLEDCFGLLVFLVTVALCQLHNNIFGISTVGGDYEEL